MAKKTSPASKKPSASKGKARKPAKAVALRSKDKDFIQISDYTSLDALIRYLETIRGTLPADAEPELTMRGDDVFGRRLTISFLRELTPEEAALDARYTGHEEPELDSNIEQLRRKLDDVPYKRSKKRG